MSRGKRHRTISPSFFNTGSVSTMGTMWSWDPRYRCWGYPQNYGSNYPTNGTSLRKSSKECWDDLHPGPPYRTGGPFFVRSMQYSVPSIHASIISHWDCTGVNIRKYDGWFYIPKPTSLNLSEVDTWLERAATFGAQAWRMFTPDKPAADLGQFWYELRDLRSMFDKVGLSLKGLASGYLNYAFGWTPFLKDIVKLINALSKIESIVARLVKYNGQWQKRSGVVKEALTSSGHISMGNLISPILTGEFYVGAVTSSGYMSTETVDQTWFEAKVKHYIPELENPGKVQCAKLLAKIVGLDFTKPSLYWKIFPYSWLVDWFGNMTHLIEGMETLLSTDLVAKYAYVMDERVKTVDIWQDQPLKCDDSISLRNYYELRSKERATASPMGFGPSVITLSPKQLAILAALGIQGNFGSF